MLTLAAILGVVVGAPGAGAAAEPAGVTNPLDLDRDGVDDVIARDAAGQDVALEGTTGRVLWRAPQLGVDVVGGLIGVDLDRDGVADLVNRALRVEGLAASSCADGICTTVEGMRGTQLRQALSGRTGRVLWTREDPYLDRRTTRRGQGETLGESTSIDETRVEVVGRWDEYGMQTADDRDHDGIPDLLRVRQGLTAESIDNRRTGAGFHAVTERRTAARFDEYAEVISGANGTVVSTIHNPTSQTTQSRRPLGDVTGDGVQDFLRLSTVTTDDIHTADCYGQGEAVTCTRQDQDGTSTAAWEVVDGVDDRALWSTTHSEFLDLAGDLNGDGGADLFASDFTDRMTVARVRAVEGRTGRTLWQKPGNVTLLDASLVRPGDPQLFLLRQGTDVVLQRLRRDGTVLSTTRRTAPPGRSIDGIQAQLVPDADSDGRVDALVTYSTSKTSGLPDRQWIWILESGSTGARLATRTAPGFGRATPRDLDGDSLTDVLSEQDPSPHGDSTGPHQAVRGKDGATLWSRARVAGMALVVDDRGRRGQVLLHDSRNGKRILRVLDGATGVVRWSRSLD